MSPARAKPGADNRSHVGDMIVAELRASGLPLEPRQFEFWFAYKSGRNAALNAAANEIKSKQGALTARDIERLHEAHLSPWRVAERPDELMTRIDEKLRDVAITLEGAIGSAQTQRATLATEAAQLGGSDALTLQHVRSAIDRLTEVTREGQTRFSLLEARMGAATREIGTLRQQLLAVRAEAQADPTTALPTRAAFNGTLAKTLEAAAEARQPVSVALCNLDYFTAFNETFGNHKGDQVLRAIGMLVKAQMPPGEMVARYGGDEYAVILPRLRASDAVEHAERFRQVLMANIFVEHQNGAGRITVSIGVADAIKGDTPDFLMRRAANGLKVAKREGRNRVVEMSPDGPIWDAERRM
jgi:diguanylate cyclase